MSRIREERLSDEEADKVLKCVPMISGHETIVKVFKEEKCNWKPEFPTLYIMSSAAINAIFDNLTSGAGRRAKLEYNTDLLIHDEGDCQNQCNVCQAEQPVACD